MSEKEMIQEFLEMFPECPDPEHYPIQVQYLIKIYKFHKELNKKVEDVL